VCVGQVRAGRAIYKGISAMRVKLFWKNEPGKPAAGTIKQRLSFGRARELENEINDWLQENPGIKITTIKQSASGGSLAGSLWLVSVWFEESQ
jgi:hypothetical protein